jgi:hypothetical protein
MVVDSPDTDAVGLQPVVNQINVFAIFEVKGEVRAGSFISRSEQGQTIPTFSSFQIAPVVSLPDQAHTQPGVKNNGSVDILNTDGDMAETTDAAHQFKPPSTRLRHRRRDT